MKYLVLIASRLKQYVCANKLIFSLYFIGCVAAAVTTVYFYGNVVSTKIHQAQGVLENRYYEVDLASPQKLSELDLKRFNTYGVGEVMVGYTLTQADVKTAAQFTMPPPMPYVKADVNGSLKAYSSAGRVDFSSSELKNGANVISMPRSSVTPDDIGKDFEIKGTKYRIIGINTMRNYFYVPYQSFVKTGLPVTQVTYILNKALEPSMRDAFLKELAGVYPGCFVDVATFYNGIDRNNFPYEMFLLGVIYLVSLFSFMFLMKYMVDSNARENIVYSLVGAKRRVVFCVIIAENLILTALASGVGILLHILLRDSLFEKINIYKNVLYTPGDYLLILGLMLAVSIVTAIPFFGGYYKNSLIVSKNRYYAA